MPTAVPWQGRLLSSAVLLAIFAGCSGPSFIDKECIKGRISNEQAESINRGPWEHLPSYNRNPEGQCANCAEEKDRILAAKCSNFIKEVSLQDL